MPAHDAMMASAANALLNLVMPTAREQLALARNVQRNPVKPVIGHVDLVIVRKGESHGRRAGPRRGEAAPGTVVTVEQHAAGRVRGDPHIPEGDRRRRIDGAEARTQILAGSIGLPEVCPSLATPGTSSSM